jgi:outer membrane lipoprotein-sorting protein
VAALALGASACAVSRKRVVPPAERRPALEATSAQLLDAFNQQARAVRSLNATVELHTIAGSTYTGVIEDYREVRGFILAQKPSHIRVIGQAPVVATNIFDMVSDGETFRIFIPSKNKFITGPAQLERAAQKPIENLRPQHLLDAVFWNELPATALFEEQVADPQRYYVLTELRGEARPEITRKVWFDRADLSIARIQVYAPGGRLVADVSYGDWQGVAQPSGGPAEVRYPRYVRIVRPRDDYTLEVRIVKLALNEEISAERFLLAQPAGTELVRVGEPPAEARP